MNTTRFAIAARNQRTALIFAAQARGFAQRKLSAAEVEPDQAEA